MNVNGFRNYFSDQIESTRELFHPGQLNKRTPCKLEKTLVREIEVRHEKLQAVYAELDELGPGMIMQNGSGDSWALILPDASEPGRFRYSVFRNIGWMSHFTTDTIDEAVLEAFKSGFTQVAPRDTLDKLSATLEWKKGCERLVHHEAHQRGAMSFDDMLAKFEEIEAKHHQQLLVA
ncbi:hypothetical protein H8F21_15025 [Pseudomonas sp. P66]|uniref:Uncharacterized protein n=1 Tax=Pseudomonas arcuscaelestis TaxID=2710591 RepID=A0ABS2BZ32_9PSED|nr:hypothetical protein [Pseudomonas arcuscaelestis]MBM5458877.1 hypothetical protein [Pseudomonas arcuscaelestis]